MSATDIVDTGIAMPRMATIEALPGLRLAVTWSQGSRAGKTDQIDLAPVIQTYKFYRPLRKNEELFRTATLARSGSAVEWADGDLDMSAETLESLAEQTMSPQQFAAWMQKHRLTQEAAAAILGYSRRQIAYFVSTGPIPRVVALACKGYTQEEMMKNLEHTLHVEANLVTRWELPGRHLPQATAKVA